MSGGGEWKEDRCRPPKERRDGPCQQISYPTEVSRPRAALELRKSLGGERAAKENGEQ